MKKPASILIVEDDGLIAMQLQEFLKRSGYDVPDPVASGEEAIESVNARLPDLVLMDIRLGGEIDGIEAARQIRKAVSVPVIFLTAHTDMNDLSRTRQVRASGCIAKPFIEDDVLAAIGKALRR